MKALVWALLMFGTLLAHGCAGASFTGEPDPMWDAAPVRELWPEYATEPACLTVWVIDGECAVADETGEPRQCASAVDPLVLNAVPDPFGTCIVGIESCEVRRCPETN